MTHEQLQQIRAIVYDAYCEGDTEAGALLVVIDAALAAPEQEPVAWIHPDIAQRLINGEMVGTILGMDKSSHRTFPLYTHPMPETAAPHARDAVAWMPDTGYVFAPDKNTAPVPAPQREWVGLTDQDIEDASPIELDRHLFGFARSIEAALRAKNEEKNT